MVPREQSQGQRTADSQAGRNRLIALEFLRTGCVDCGNADIRVQEFDHLPEHEKRFGISRAIRGSVSTEKLIEEIKKCEVVCANCHVIRTRERQNDWRCNI